LLQSQLEVDRTRQENALRILFTSVPIHSHVLPLLPLMDAAKRAGHRVAMATGAAALVQLERNGIDGFACGPTPAHVQEQYAQRYPALSQAAPSLPAAERFINYVVHAMLGIYAPAMIADMQPLVQRWRPDLIVSTPAEFAGEIVAALSGVAFARHSFSPPKTAAAWRPVSDQIAKLRDQFGLTASTTAADPYIDIWPAALRPFEHDTALAHPAALPLRPDSILPRMQPLAARPAILDGLPDRETVYVTAGTTYNQTPGLLEAMLDALRDRDVNAVVTIGHNVDIKRFGAPDPHIRVIDYLPQETLLPHCHAVICNAGAGSVLGALAHGLPVVTVPCAADQHEIAAGVARSGAGIACPPWPVSTNAIAEAVNTISQTPFRQSAKRIQQTIAAMPQPAAVLETLIASLPANVHQC
jgi:UDP:flavonoid glycosyltransferase YjiC (YdhE family)